MARLESGELRELRDAPVITPKTIPLDDSNNRTAAGFEELAQVDSVPADESSETTTPTTTDPVESQPSKAQETRWSFDPRRVAHSTRKNGFPN